MREFFHKMQQKRVGRLVLYPGIPLVIMGVIIICAIFAPYIAPYEPNKGDLYDQFIVPVWMEGGSSEHLLGTDYFGRDVLSRLIYGARISISIAFASIVISGLLGTVLGLISGYVGGIVDTIIMRMVDGTLSIPYIMLAILFAAVFGASYLNVIIIIVIFTVPIYARQMRAEALAIKERDHVALAKVAGVSPARIMYKHFFPNVLPTILIISTLDIGTVIMVEAMMSFLGVGVPPPTASWGSMTASGQEYVMTLWWISAIPGAAILMTILSANILGDWIRDRFDPRLRQL